MVDSVINSQNYRNESGVGQNGFTYGDVKVEFANWGGIKQHPISFQLSDELTDLIFSFKMTLPDTIGYFVKKVPFEPCDIYINDVWFGAGNMMSAKRNRDGTCEYEFLGDGYQIAKSYLIKKFTPEKTTTIKSFLYDIIHQNLRVERKSDLFEKVLHDVAFLPLTLHSFENMVWKNTLKQLKTKKSVVYTKYLIYDPFHIGDLTLEQAGIHPDLLKIEDNKKIFDVIREILGSANIFVKCIGKFERIKDNLDKNYLYPSPSNDFKTTDYVLLLWRPNYNDYNNPRTTYGKKEAQIEPIYQDKEQGNSIQVNKGMLKNNLPVNNILMQWKDDANTIYKNQLNRMQKAGMAQFTYIYADITKEKRDIKEKIYQPIYTIDKINNFNLMEQPEEIWDFKDRYDTVVFKTTTSFVDKAGFIEKNLGLAKDKTREYTDFIYSKDEETNDGTTFLNDIDVKFKEKALENFAYYDQVKRRCSSYKVELEVKGYNQIPDKYDPKNKLNNNRSFFWSVNQLILFRPKLVKDYQIFLITKIEMNCDTSKGHWTRLTLQLPTTYSMLLPSTLDNTLYQEDYEKAKKELSELSRKGE